MHVHGAVGKNKKKNTNTTKTNKNNDVPYACCAVGLCFLFLMFSCDAAAQWLVRLLLACVVLLALCGVVCFVCVWLSCSLVSASVRSVGLAGGQPRGEDRAPAKQVV